MLIEINEKKQKYTEVNNKNILFVIDRQISSQLFSDKNHALCQEGVNSVMSVALYSSILIYLQYQTYCVFKDDSSKIFIITKYMDMLYSSNINKQKEIQLHGSKI